MENEVELKPMLRLLPLVIRSSNFFWPSPIVESLHRLSIAPLDSGESLFSAISSLRNSLSCYEPLAPSTQQGYSLFFDELISRAESSNWFSNVLPGLANLLLRFPSLLESHYLNRGPKTALRLLYPQHPGIVLLPQELIAALLACALFCLFPVADRADHNLPIINFDHLFHNLYESYSESLENKIKSIMHYFERICSSIPAGYVSFERKVLPFEQILAHISYPRPEFWSKSTVPLCPFQVYSSGFIEDQSNGALEVDFANKYLGGGALSRGCVQEEIRFMINPELIVGMLFLPAMEDNEAIEIVGAERFSDYRGYASSFRFAGDHVDKRNVDSFGRRKTQIIAIDALCSPGMKQYKLEYLIRETNKAFCGFYDQSKYDQYERLFQENGREGTPLEDDKDTTFVSKNKFGVLNKDTFNSVHMEMKNREITTSMNRFSDKKSDWCLDCGDDIGIATGNWGCGAFGGDPELKTIIQWLAASQALRPSVLYHTFGIEALQNLKKVSEWILLHEWTVGDLWNLLVEYSSQRSLNKETKSGFFMWLLPTPN